VVSLSEFSWTVLLVCSRWCFLTRYASSRMTLIASGTLHQGTRFHQRGWTMAPLPTHCYRHSRTTDKVGSLWISQSRMIYGIHLCRCFHRGDVTEERMELNSLFVRVDDWNNQDIFKNSREIKKQALNRASWKTTQKDARCKDRTYRNLPRSVPKGPNRSCWAAEDTPLEGLAYSGKRALMMYHAPTRRH
jgi:hypothetical protein